MLFLLSLLRWFFRLLFSGLFLVFAVAGVYLLIMGADLSLSMGKLWFDADLQSLNLFQVIIERYIYYPLWDGMIVPILQFSGYIVLGVGSLASLLLAAIAWRL